MPLHVRARRRVQLARRRPKAVSQSATGPATSNATCLRGLAVQSDAIGLLGLYPDVFGRVLDILTVDSRPKDATRLACVCSSARIAVTNWRATTPWPVVHGLASGGVVVLEPQRFHATADPADGWAGLLSAVDSVPVGGSLLLLPGVFHATERLAVVGIHLFGRGRAEVRLTAAPSPDSSSTLPQSLVLSTGRSLGSITGVGLTSAGTVTAVLVHRSRLAVIDCEVRAGAGGWAVVVQGPGGEGHVTRCGVGGGVGGVAFWAGKRGASAAGWAGVIGRVSDSRISAAAIGVDCLGPVSRGGVAITRNVISGCTWGIALGGRDAGAERRAFEAGNEFRGTTHAVGSPRGRRGRVIHA